MTNDNRSSGFIGGNLEPDETENNSTEFYSNYLLSEIDRDNFTTSNFYIYPKCLLLKTCDEDNYLNYIQFVGSIKDMNMLFYSNNSDSSLTSKYAKHTGNSKQVINFNSGAKVDVYFKYTTIKTDYSIFPFYYKKRNLQYFSFDKTDTVRNSTFIYAGPSGDKLATHQEYNFYLSSYSDNIYFRREPIDFFFARIVGSFYVYYFICYIICVFANKYKQEIYLFNKIGRHIFYDDTTNVTPSISHHLTTIHSNNENEEHSNKKAKKNDTLWFYNQNNQKTNFNVNITKTSSSNNAINVDNSKLKLKSPKGKNDIKIAPLKSKNYFGKINRKPTTLNISCYNRIKLICCASSINNKNSRYIYLMQNFFELTTYLSSTIDIIKLKKVLLNDGIDSAKHQDEIIFNNILMSKQNLDNELLVMNSPERSILSPNEMLPLTLNSQLANSFIMK